jgi:hypothetical protein
VPAATVRALLAGLIDYAGLFPPAALPMSGVVANHSTYRASGDAWALGRLVVPVARFTELFAALAAIEPPRTPWRISALVGNDVERDAAAIRGWNDLEAERAMVDAAEVKATSVEEIDVATQLLGGDVTTYVEIPVADDPAELIAEIGRSGACAKIRTGGVTADAFPRADDVARFIAACARRNVPFKATAGLHHPLRGDYRLTYETNAPCGSMYGFLNIFVAAAFARAGMAQPELVLLLAETNVSQFEFADAGLAWGEYVLTLSQVADARGSFAHSFGSCSFREPIDDLVQLGLL